MSKRTIEDITRDLIVEQLGIEQDKVTPSARLSEDLDCDSLDTVELVMAFEEEFDISINDEETERITTVQDIIGLIRSKNLAID